MPLDLRKVITQLRNLESQESINLKQERLGSTYRLFKSACEDYKKLLERLLETKSSKKANFFFATPEHKLNENLSLENLIECNKNFSLPHVVVGTDGSQINPSNHEITSTFLINIGQVCIPYFSSNIPVLLTSKPAVYNSLEEINSISSGDVVDEDLVSYERTLKEVEELVELAKSYKSHNLPIVALLDGTLIHWHLEKFSNVFIEHFINRFSKSIHELKSLGIPVVSVLSNSRSNDLINMLRIFKCPYEIVDCKKHCSDINSKNLPCNPCMDYKPVFDRRLVEEYFIKQNAALGTRTIVFESNNKILGYYPGDLKIYFFYINTGTEIARVELPAYVACDKKLLELVHNVIFLQCKVGFGYPVVLSEAHLQAVVTRSDRQVFYDLMKEHMLKTKQMPLKVSSKELRKRVSFV